MADIEDEWGGDFDEIDDRFTADVSTVDAQDTLDVSAQFFRVCARVYMDNPLHYPVYQWLSRLPRTGNGNIKAISEHLVLALRLYVDTLNSGSTLRLEATDANAGAPVRDRSSGGHARLTPSAAATPSQIYRQSRGFKDTLSNSGDTASGRPARAPVGDRDSGGSPSSPSPAPSSGSSSSSTDASAPHGSPATPTARAPSASGKPPSSADDGLSYVARLAREGDGW